jgi:REP element-mobilizing transposase RayT
MPDHIHMLIGLRPVQSLSSLVQNIKNETSKWINTNQLCDSKFQWQEGFGAFSYSKSQINNVIKYIQNQEQHHLKKTFLEEYVSFLEAFEIDWNEQFIFKELI